jgi:hypothetical protein
VSGRWCKNKFLMPSLDVFFVSGALLANRRTQHGQLRFAQFG